MSVVGKTVLVVDDESDIRDLVQVILQSELGVRTLSAADGKQALEALRGQHPALIVTDVRMPNLDGIEMIRRLRACESTRRLPVLVVAASHSGRDEAMAAGADDYLDKPFDVDELLRKASRLMRPRPLTLMPAAA